MAKSIEADTTPGYLGEELERVLALDPDECSRRNRQLWNVLQSKVSGDTLVLFGAGFIGRRALPTLQKIGLSVVAWTDNNPALWGKEIDGVSVLPPEEAARMFGSVATFVTCVYNHDVVDAQLTRLGCKAVAPYTVLFWGYDNYFLPCYSFDLPHAIRRDAAEVRRAMSLWSDRLSQLNYVGQLRWHCEMKSDHLPPLTNLADIYFPNDIFALRADERFLDAGAFDGDTIRSVLARTSSGFHSVVAMEPDQQNRSRLNAYLATLPSSIREKIVVRDQAIGASECTVHFKEQGDSASSCSADGERAVTCVSVDGDPELRDRHFTFQKYDIEGAEPEALAGARNAILQDRPVLAVCVYHALDHLWKLPLKMADMCPNYSFFLRRYLGEFWDVVAYAVPRERLNQNASQS